MTALHGGSLQSSVGFSRMALAMKVVHRGYVVLWAYSCANFDAHLSATPTLSLLECTEGGYRWWMRSTAEVRPSSLDRLALEHRREIHF